MFTVGCFSGGGTKIAWHAGLLNGLTLAGVRFDAFAGVSAGSIVAGYMALVPREKQQEQASNLCAIIRGLKETPYRMGTVRAIWRVVTQRPSLFTDEPLLKLLRTHIKHTPIMPLRIGVTELVTGRYLSLGASTPSGLINLMRASCAVPVTLPPVGLGRWVDGGVRHVCPHRPAVALAKDLAGDRDVRMIVSYATPKAAWDENLNPMDWHAKMNCWNIALQAIDLEGHESMRTDWERTAEINEICTVAPEYAKKKKWIPIDVRRFDAPPQFTDFGTNEVDPDKLNQLIEVGSRTGYEWGAQAQGSST